ncbi:hypothetical protein Hanom_Chr12g01164581 [Helianthus anomalus]
MFRWNTEGSLEDKAGYFYSNGRIDQLERSGAENVEVEFGVLLSEHGTIEIGYARCPFLNIIYCPPSEAVLGDGKSLVISREIMVRDQTEKKLNHSLLPHTTPNWTIGITMFKHILAKLQVLHCIIGLRLRYMYHLSVSAPTLSQLPKTQIQVQQWQQCGILFPILVTELQLLLDILVYCCFKV